MDSLEPNDDPAARFRKPDEPASSAAPAPALPAQEPHGFMQVFEDTFTAPLGLGAVFGKLDPLPAPGYGALCANVAVFAAAFLGVNLLRARLTFPEAFAVVAPTQIGAGSAFLFIGMFLSSFAAAGVLHALARAAGGQGDYQRSYQTLSLLSAFGPVVAACHAFPYGWIAASLFWTYLTIEAVEHLHHSSAAATRGVFWTVALAFIGAGFYVELQAQKAVEVYLAPFKMMAQIKRQQQDAQATQNFQQQAAAYGSAPGQPAAQAVDPAQAQQLFLQTQQMLQQLQAAPVAQGAAQTSGLGLVTRPDQGQPAAKSQEPAPKELQAQARAIQQTGANALGSVMPMLNNPAMFKNMPPAQAEQMRQMVGMLGTLQGSMASGKPLTPEQQAQMKQMQQAQMQMLMQMMGKMGPAPTAGQAPQAAPQQPQQAGGQ